MPLVDASKKEVLRDALSLKSDKVNFTQAEQALLMGDIGTYSRMARKLNIIGYGQHEENTLSIPHFTLYDSTNSQLILNQIQGSDSDQKQKFVDSALSVNDRLNASIQLFRVFRDPRDHTKIIREAELDVSSARFNRQLPGDESKEMFYRGEYGLKNLDVEIKNQNPFAASRMVDVSMTFLLRSIVDLDIAASYNGVKLRDLMTFSGKRSLVPNQDYYGGYNLKLVLGYAPLSFQGSTPDNLWEVAQIGMEKCKLTLNLELIDYDLTVAPSGEIELTLQYASWIEESTKKASIDIFAGKIFSKTQISDSVEQQNTAASLRGQ